MKAKTIAAIGVAVCAVSAMTADAVSQMTGRVIPDAPGRFANYEVLSYSSSADTVGRVVLNAPGGGAGTRRPTAARLGASPSSGEAETSSETWVVRSAANTNRTFAVRRARLASGEISMCAYSPNRVLATLAAGKSYATFVQEMAARGLHVVRELMRDLDGNAVYIIEAAETENDIVEQMTMSIEETGSCTMVRPDSIYEANAVPNDTNYADQWGLEKIGAPEAWNSRTDASTVLVAVLDTGVNYDHIDLNQNLWVNPDETPGDGVDNDGNGIEDDVYGMASIGGNVSGNSMDDNGHGSHCAGIIGAAGNNRRLVSGVTWKAKVMALKFLDSEGSGFVSDAVTCLRYAEDHGVKIVNCSFGQSGTFDDYLYIQMKKMSQQGTIFACAAGNAKAGESPRDNDEFPFYPCNYSVDTIVSVAATDQNDALANFSYYGAQNVDIAAPGVNIYSTVLGSYGLGYKSGTSMATPHVTGALALLMAHYPGDTPAQIIDRLYAAAEPVPALAGKVRTGARLSMAGFFGISAPSEISVSQGTVNDAVVLYWTSVAEATHYRVWRSAEEGGEKTMLGDWRQGLTYSDETAEPGVTYWYYLQAASSAEGSMASTFSQGVSGYRPAIDTSRITVSFNPVGGTVSPAKKVYRIGQTYSEMPVPTYSGKAFLGWFTAASGGTRLGEPSLVRADATTLYAQWIGADVLRVENLFARQRYPWNGYVDVTFNLFGVPNDETASVSLTAQEEAGGSPLALRTFVGKHPTNLVNGAQHVVWNATPDTQGILYTNLILAATVAIDEKPLLPPANVSASNATDSDAVVVTWSASENATSYEVWRAAANNSASASKIASPTTTSYRDTSAVPATTYWYWVKAVNSKKTSEFSPYASGSRKKIATAVAITGPASVTAGGTATYTCTATYNDSTTATVTPTWSITSGSSYASISSSGVLSANGTATQRSVTIQASYSYNGSTQTMTKNVTINTRSVTISFNANGGSVSPTSQSYTAYGTYGSLPTPTRSQYSFLGWFTESSGGTQVTTSSTVPANATTLWAHWQQAIPNPPMGLTATQDRTDGIVVSWTVSTGATSYEIYRQTYSSSSSSVKIGTSTTTSYTDTTAVGDQTYYYWVKAVGNGGTSGFGSYAQGKRIRTLTSVEIDGPDALMSECGGYYTAWANYSDGTQASLSRGMSITTNLYATLSSYGTESGAYRWTLTAKSVDSRQYVYMTASNTYNGVTKTATKTISVLPSGNLTYTYRTRPDGTAELTGYKGDTTVTELTLPSSINGLTVTRTSGSWMQNLSSLTRVTIPSSFTEVAYSMFYYCRRLTNVTIPNSVTNIGDSAFRYCYSIQQMVIPSSVKTIGSYAFYSCSLLRQVIIPDSVTSIGNYAFESCTSLTSVTIPDSVTRLQYAFSSCTALQTVKLPSNLNYTYESFIGCTNLTSFTLSSENAHYKTEDGILFNKAGTELISYPANKSGSSYTVPSTVEKLSRYAFWRNQNLISLMLPASVTYIEPETIYDCAKLQSITAPTSNPAYRSIDGILYNKNRTRLIAYPSAKATTLYVMPDSIWYWTRFISDSLSSLVLSDSLYNYEDPENIRCAHVKLPSTVRGATIGKVNIEYNIPATVRNYLSSSGRSIFTVNCFGDAPTGRQGYFYKTGTSRYFPETSGWGKGTYLYNEGTWMVWTNPILSLEIDGENKVFAGCSVPLYAKGSFESGHFGIASKADWMVANGSSYASINPSNGVLTANANVTSSRNISVYAWTTLGGASAYANTYNVQIVPANTNTALIAIGKYAYNRLRWLPYPNAAKYNIRRGTSSTYANASIIDTYLKETLDGTETFVDDTAALGTTYYYWVEALDANGNTLNVTDSASATRATGDLTYVRDVLTKLNNGTYTEGSFVTDAEKGILKEINYWKGVNETWMNYIRTGALTSIVGANEMFWRSMYDLNTYIPVVMGMGGSPAVSVERASSTSAVIRWDAKLGATSYQIYRGTSSNSSSATRIATVSSGTSYTNTSLSDGTYYYWVKAVTPTGTTDFGEGFAYRHNSMTATYVVIDLSGGANATSYPVASLSSVPSGGWTDEYKTTKLVLRKISAGSFTMGCETTEVGYYGEEAVPHTVTISQPFYMGVFEVTQKQYELVMGSNPSLYKGDMRPVEYVSYNMIRGSSDGAGWPGSSAVDGSSFMGKIRAKTGLTFDLPTEAKWEYACRAGTTTALNNGKNLTNGGSGTDSQMDEVGRYGYNQSDGKGGYWSGHTTVGSYKPNNWGLYDMHGNVWEWTLDRYQGRDSFTSAAVSDPIGPSSGLYRVLRGGCWGSKAQSCRSANRSSSTLSPGSYYIGFRLCCPAGQ